jgi:tRNA(Ile)-lysidine synthase
MASSRKRPSVKRIAVGLSGGVDSVVLLHQLKDRGVSAIHVHHGLSANADAWADFCRSLCKRLGIPLSVVRVRVRKSGKGLEAAAREARYAAFRKSSADVIALAHNLDDQAETVLMNLLRGAGVRGASGMAEESRLGAKRLWRPLLRTPRVDIEKYARENKLRWVEDDSNANQALTRNFIRRSVGPLLERKFPQWKQSLARAARHFAKKQAGREDLLRAFLRSKGLKAPSEAKLAEMLKQLAANGSRTLIEHEGARLRMHRGKVLVENRAPRAFVPLQWSGERRLELPGGELRFRRVRGKGIALTQSELSVRPRSGGERLQPDPRRPRRTLKNLFQEAGVPAWERDGVPLLFSGDELVCIPGIGVDARWRASDKSFGWVAEWRPKPLFLRKTQGERDKISP